MSAFLQSGAALHPVSGDPAEQKRKQVEAIMHNPGKESVEKIAQELKTTMTENCGIFRDEGRLTQALKDVQALKARFQKAGVMDKSARFNTDLLAALETKHLLTFSEVLVAGALARTESRGAHSRTDYKKRDDQNWLKHTLAHKSEHGPVLSYKTVCIDWEKYPPQERKY
jgi:succinate dehydrogenase / fumarate reductase flavoprotein subunit